MKTLRPIKANRGVLARYQTSIQHIIEQMCADYLVSMAYIYSVNHILAENSLENIDKELKEKKNHWKDLFLLFIGIYTVHFVRNMSSYSEKALQNALIESGLSVSFKPNKVVDNTIEALTKENVSLISNIPDEYHSKIEGILLRGYSQSKPVSEIKEEIEGLLSPILARGNLISNDQANKINVAIQKVRLNELGITRVMWDHGGAYRKEPRKSHIEASGTVFDLNEGCYIDGEHIQPGEKINCKCIYRAVLPY